MQILTQALPNWAGLRRKLSNSRAPQRTAADAAGNFSHPLGLNENGLYTLEATGLKSGHVVTSQDVVHSEAAAVVVADGPGAKVGAALATPA